MAAAPQPPIAPGRRCCSWGHGLPGPVAACHCGVPASFLPRGTAWIPSALSVHHDLCHMPTALPSWTRLGPTSGESTAKNRDRIRLADYSTEFSSKAQNYSFDDEANCHSTDAYPQRQAWSIAGTSNGPLPPARSRVSKPTASASSGPIDWAFDFLPFSLWNDHLFGS